MNQETHDKYFKNIDYNTNSDVTWKVVNNEGEVIVSEGTVPNYVTGIYYRQFIDIIDLFLYLCLLWLVRIKNRF